MNPSTGHLIPHCESPSPRLQQLDMLEWQQGLCFTAHGVRVGIRANDVRVIERIAPLLPLGFQPLEAPNVQFLYSVWKKPNSSPADGGAVYQLYAGGQLVASSTRLDAVVDDLQSAVDFGMALGSPRRIFVHAGVVGWRERAIIVPGESGSGKTSLVAQLVRAGATYYSDEFAVIDEHGLVYHYPRPLRVRPFDGGPRKHVSVDELGGQVGLTPLIIGLVLLTKFVPGATWEPRTVPAGEALLRMLSNTVAARTRSRDVLSTLRQVVVNSPVVASERGEVADVAPRILELIRE